MRVKSSHLIKRLAFVLLSVLLCVDVFSQGPPIYTDTPILFGLEGGGIRTFGKYISMQDATVYMQPLIIPYNPSSKFLVAAVIPYVRKSPKGMETQTGIGDLTIVGKYLIFQRDKSAQTFRTALKVSETFPTGKTSTAPPIGADAYQTSIGLVNGFVTTKYGVYGEVNYNLTSNGLPDEWIYNFAFSLPLLPQKYPPNQLNVSLELTGNYQAENQINRLFVAPGIQYIAGRRLLVEAGIQLPLQEDVPDAQKTNYMLLIGTRVLIF